MSQRLSPRAGCALAYDWHRNNVRELRNVIERMVLASDEMIGVDSVPAESEADATPRNAIERQLPRSSRRSGV
jgi:DNA-binding NtrC family response regulator